MLIFHYKGNWFRIMSLVKVNKGRNLILTVGLKDNKHWSNSFSANRWLFEDKYYNGLCQIAQLSYLSQSIEWMINGENQIVKQLCTNIWFVASSDDEFIQSKIKNKQTF